MTVKEAIKNLELMSETLGTEANKPKHYNTDWAYYLEQMSWQMQRNANDLREIDSMLNVTT